MNFFIKTLGAVAISGQRLGKFLENTRGCGPAPGLLPEADLVCLPGAGFLEPSKEPGALSVRGRCRPEERMDVCVDQGSVLVGTWPAPGSFRRPQVWSKSCGLDKNFKVLKSRVDPVACAGVGGKGRQR